MSSINLINELSAIFTQKQRQLYVAAVAITRERSSAEDSVHDALVAMASLSEKPENLEAYLFRTVRNKALHSIKQRNRVDGNSDPVEFLDIEECSASQKVFVSQIVERMTKLDENSRQVLIMKLFADLTFKEIASIMQSPPNTVASWYRRGIGKLKEEVYEQHI